MSGPRSASGPREYDPQRAAQLYGNPSDSPAAVSGVGSRQHSSTSGEARAQQMKASLGLDDDDDGDDDVDDFDDGDVDTLEDELYSGDEEG
eukprot:CAMPEP_0197587410 /NCGR_PEP_ID=MMETSP1326-20131121/9058_1 /TAXON_ID=1155430 /ORGANISM="Genus nov. species nov., Strain RCC2288" /LENGTH=90 /DNA_ID=CAMNT_0043152141 /DNA_START=29 /DNA_END=297 /DNA_ORIENTATION=+